MPISSELFLAILAMDSYNRGYTAGLGGPVDGLGKTGQIGNATIGQTSEILLDASGQRQDISASFFAQSYTLTGSYASRSGGPSLIAGEKIISYRGTDNAGVDVFTGWPLGPGDYSATQGGMALDFHKSVNGGSASTNSSIVTTGHSLGGGLAGFVGSLHGLKGMVFDSMAFELAATRAANDDAPCALQAGPAA